MSGEKQLSVLLKNLKPALQAETYVFCCATGDKVSAAMDHGPIATFREAEGTTVVVTEQQAKNLGLKYEGLYKQITLQIHSSLEAVGLTAAVANALKEANISANVIAAYYHDHIFVPIERAQQAVNILLRLSKTENE